MFATELQSEQVQTHPQKFAPTLALKWYRQDLIVLTGQAELFDTSAENQNQGGMFIFSPHISSLASKKARFTVANLSFGRLFDCLHSDD